MKRAALVSILMVVFFSNQNAAMMQSPADITPVVSVDFSIRDPGAKSQVGILHGLNASQPPDSAINPLSPKQWRKGNFDAYDRVVATGARFQIVPSDLWGYPNSTNGWPYNNFAAYEDFVRSVARANKSKTVLWDVWNEPTIPFFWAGTIEQFFETYRRAYTVLRQELGPDAMIGGPTYHNYNKSLLVSFLDFCKANSCEVNFLTWHELTRDIPSIADHLAEARQSFLNNPTYAGLKIREIQVNESLGPINKHSPGAIAGTFYYLEKGRSDGSCKACWDDSHGSSECNNNTLDGLLTPDTFQPRAGWWAYKTYADGASSRVQSTTTEPRVVALASSQSQSANRAQVLIGYFDIQGSPPTTTVQINLNNLNNLAFIGANQQVHVKVEKIPNSDEQPLPGPVLVSEQDLQISSGSSQVTASSEQDVQASGGTLQLTIDNLALNEAYLVSLTEPPQITSAQIAGKNLLIIGQNFDSGAVILLNGDQQRTLHDDQNPNTLIGKKVGRKIAPGQTVTLQVRNSDGTLSPAFSFTRP